MEKILSGITKTQRVANAYLFTSGDPDKKLDSALLFAKKMNCSSPNPPCSTCPSCLKAQKGIHPDILVIEKRGASLKIEQIRELKEYIKYGPSFSKWMFVILKDTDSLTAEASNSFLKSLEEPPPRVTFILLSNKERTLPRTILSRCQKIIFPESEKLEIDEEVKKLYLDLNRGSCDFIDLTNRLLKYKESESLLSQIFFLFAKDQKDQEARETLKALRAVKRRANKKLALDVMGINLWIKN